jgi:hypothetical protein
MIGHNADATSNVNFVEKPLIFLNAVIKNERTHTGEKPYEC